jgi:hypothetical protein
VRASVPDVDHDSLLVHLWFPPYLTGLWNSTLRGLECPLPSPPVVPPGGIANSRNGGRTKSPYLHSPSFAVEYLERSEQPG